MRRRQVRAFRFLGTGVLGTILAMALLLSIGGAALAVPSVTLYLEACEYASCPFIFSWDGGLFQLENDLYSVARGQEREYTDYLKLNNVVPKNGVYAFEVAEVPSENSWTDTLKLITVDHPANVAVGVDSLGNVHSYANPQLPLSAINALGSDVLALIAARDGSGVDMYHGDALVIDFSSIDIASGAKLVINVDGFEGPPQGAIIPEIPAIQIQTLVSGSWTTQYSFFPKELSAEAVFDLKSYLTESQSVRLLGVSCLEEKYHIIDYVALDNTADTLNSSVLEPVSAVLNGSVDVLNGISNSDDVYTAMVENDVLSVTFPFNLLTDEVRSFAIISEGYYVQVPGGNTYYVDTWNGSSWVQRASWSFPSSGDTVKSFDLTSYLPDPTGEYRVKIRNYLAKGAYGWAQSRVDYVYLNVGGTNYPATYAKESDTIDILSLVVSSNNTYWSVSGTSTIDRWAIVKFNLPPSANTGGPYAGTEGTSLSFNGTGSTDPEGKPLAYYWTFGDGGTATVATPTHTYVDNGNYTVTLKVTDNGGLTDTKSTTASIANVAPAVTPGPNPTIDEGGSANVTATFTDPGTLDTHTATINWGDGSAPTPATVNQAARSVTGSHIYADNGTYSAVITVTDRNGASGNGTVTATVNNVAPSNVTLSADPATINENDVAAVTGSFTDPGTLDTHLVAINWGDGSGDTTLNLAAGVPSFNATHKYLDNKPADASYTVNIIVTDKDGGIGNGSTTVAVMNLAPVVTSGPDSIIAEGSPATVTAMFTDPGTLDTHKAVIDWGDGSPATLGLVDQAGRSVTGNHVYFDNGVYTVVITVTDKDRASGSGTVTVTMNNVAPASVTLSANPVTINENDVATLTGSFTDPGILDTHIVAINWGAGSADTILNLALGVTGFNATYRYLDNKPGDTSYTISIIVTDKDGGAGSGLALVAVKNVAPAIVAGSDVTLYSGQLYQLAGSFTDPGTLDTHIASVDWGDGSPVSAATVNESAGNGTATGSHIYLKPGSHTLKLTVTDKDGAATQASLVVTIKRIIVNIDIKPGSWPNSLNLNGNGVVPVGVFGSADFDVEDIDLSTVKFGLIGFEAVPAHKGYCGHIEDLNGDGIGDMVFHFVEGQLGISIDTPGNTEMPLYLTAQLTSGVYFEGKDIVRITPNNQNSQGKGGKGPK